jgi:hypothetical protein
MKKLIVARYRENIEWVNKINFEYIIYNKGKDDIEQKYIKLRNVGHETDTYLNYIISNYNNLPEISVFCQGNPFDHCHDFIEIVNNINDVDNVVWLGTNWGPITKDYMGGPGERPLPMLEMCKYLFDEEYDTNKTFTFSAGAQYMVPKKYILNKSLSWWKEAHTIFDANIETAGWVFERLWPMVWKFEAV